MTRRTLAFGFVATVVFGALLTNDAQGSEGEQLTETTWETLARSRGGADGEELASAQLFRGRLRAADGARLEGAVINLSGSSPLWLKCEAQGKEQSEPYRWLIGDGALIGGEFSRARRNGSSWFFPETNVARGPWFVTAEGCEFAYLRTSLSPHGFDRLERALENSEELVRAVREAAPFSTQEQAWLDAAAGTSRWLDRYRALRPGARSARDRKHLRPLGTDAKDRSTFVRLRDGEGVRESLWFSKAPDFGSVEPYLRLPARVVVRARRVGDAESLCLSVDGREYCQEAPDESVAMLENGSVKRLARTYDGEPVSHILSWKLVLAPGSHSLSLSGPALAAAEVMELTGVGRSLGPAPRDPVVYSGGEGGDTLGSCRPSVTESGDPDGEAASNAKCDASSRVSVSAVTPEQGAEVISLMLERRAGTERPAPNAPNAPNAPDASLPTPVWVSVPSAAAKGAADDDAPATPNGVATFWFAERDRDCKLEFPDGARFVGNVSKARNRFLWMGAAQAAAGWPHVSDCRAWLRTTESAAGESLGRSRQSYVLSRYARTAPGLPASYPAAQALAADGDDSVAGDGALWLSWPSKVSAPFNVETHDDAGTHVIKIIPLEGAATVPSSLGESYTPPARVQIRSAGPLKVRSSADIAVRLTRRGVSASPDPDNALATSDDTTESLPGASQDSSSADSNELLGELRVLSTRLAGAFRGQTSASRDARRAMTESFDAVMAADVARANLLFDRAHLLEALGEESSALTDYRWARSLAERTTGDGLRQTPNPNALTTARVLARILKDQERWMPLQGGWVNETLAHDRTLVSSFRSGDYKAIAQSDVPRERRVLAWREAIVKGQVLTAEERILAFVALLDALGTQESKHPAMWPIRTLSRWQTLFHISGATPRQEVFRTSSPPTFTERTTDALFPERWPLERVVSLREDREVVFPPAPPAPSAAPTEAADISLRCRAHNEAVLASGCVARLVDTEGKTVREITLDAVGTSALLEIPASRVPLYLQVEPQRLVTRQVLLPPTLAAAEKKRRSRTVWHLRKNTRAAVDVLAPTALRLRTRAQEPVIFAIRVERKSGQDTSAAAAERDSISTFDVATEDGELVIPIPERGVHTITITPTANVALVASMRVPRKRFIEPAADRQLLASSSQLSAGIGGGHVEEATVSRPPPDADLAIDDFPMPTEPFGTQPGSTPPFTTVLGAFVGNESVADEPEELTRQITGIALAGVTLQLGEAPAWLDAAVQAQGPRDGTVFQGRVGGEWWPLRRRARFDVMGDIRLGNGTPEQVVDGPTETLTETFPSLTTLKATFRARGGYWLADRWLAQLSLRYDARTIVDGEYPDVPANSQNPVLWSSYQDDHRQALQPAVSMRWVADRWLWLSALGVLNSNPDIVGTPDFIRAEARVDLGAPRWWFRLAGRLERRLKDDDREEPFNNPALLAKGWVTFWPHGDWALQPSAEVNYHPQFDSVTALAGLRLFWSDDRALGDVRPSRMVFRDAAAWEQGAGAEEGTE